MNQQQRPVVNVAVGVVIRPEDGAVLFGQRPPGKAYPEWWELPGGKFEPGEDAAAALARELEEEVGIHVQTSLPWVVREHQYPHAHVRLHFRRVVQWQGVPFSREGQALAWCLPKLVDVNPLLPASLGPISWLSFPSVYAISDATERGPENWLQSLQRWLSLPGGIHASASGAVRMLLLREPDMDSLRFDALFEQTVGLLRGKNVRLLVSSRHPERYARMAAEHTGGGIHLTGRDLRAWAAQGRRIINHAASIEAAQEKALAEASGVVQHPPAGQPGERSTPLMGLTEPTSGPDFGLVAASCHSADDLAMAGQLGVDFVVCGPVLPTRSHPEASATLGWDAFGFMIAQTPIPVYALGGMRDGDEVEALRQGAQGIAMQRAVWP